MVQVVTESKNLYTNALVKLLTPIFYKTFKELYKECHKSSDHSCYEQFQTKLLEIKEWDTYKIKAFYNCCEFDKQYVTKLLLIVFKLNIKILNVINDTPIGSTNLPSLKQFVYNTLLNIAQNIYECPFIFDTNRKFVSNHDISKNINKRRKLINKGIITTIENYLPIHDIIVSPQDIINVTTTTDSETNEKQSSNVPESESLSIELMKSEDESQSTPSVRLVS